MKQVIIRDRETNKIVKTFDIPDNVVETLDAIGGLSMSNFFDYKIV